MSDDKTARIRELNDHFRSTFTGGRVVVTSGVDALDEDVKQDILSAVRRFDAFTKDNDPYSEHDFGSIEINSQTFFWKIDYYDKTMEYGSEDPSDPAQTMRVMTLMRAEEY